MLVLCGGMYWWQLDYSLTSLFRLTKKGSTRRPLIGMVDAPQKGLCHDIIVFQYLCYSMIVAVVCLWYKLITVKSWWVRWHLKSLALHLKSLALRLFTQVFIQAQIKENIKAPHYWPLGGEFTGDRWIPHTKGQKREKYFHLMTSSWWPAFCMMHCPCSYDGWD